MPAPFRRGWLRRLADEAVALGECVRAGLVRPMSLPALSATVVSLTRFGVTTGALGAAAARFPDREAVLDERGSLSYAELHTRTNAIANAWRERGLRPGDGVAIVVRNHRGFLEALYAAGKCGARTVLLNCDFAGPQLREVADREGTDLLVYDDEFTALVAGIVPRLGKCRAWAESAGLDTLAALADSGSRALPPKPAVPARTVILTSGTTGTPQGAVRPDIHSLTPLGGILEKIPYRTGDVVELCAPMFHSLGFGHATMAVILGATLVVRRRFDAGATLCSLSRHRATVLIGVPVMLERILDAIPATPDVDLGSVRIVFVAGSQLGAPLCTRILHTFGPVLYNLYGSTEVSFATIATPRDLQAEPGCVGRAVLGVRVEVLGPDDRPMPTGGTGRIMVDSAFRFRGYTGGGGRTPVRGMLPSGDVGHVDAAGRLFVDGRDDDMIVSGGENVFPGEIEQVIAAHPGVREVAVTGVPDRTHGQRLRAFVVPRAPGSVDEDTVKNHVRANLARFKVPREVVLLPELPRNAGGKVLKRRLPG